MYKTFIKVRSESSEKSVEVKIFSEDDIRQFCRDEMQKGKNMIPLKDPPPKPPKVVAPISDGEGKIQKTNVKSTARPRDVQ